MTEKSHLESLQARMSKIQADIDNENGRLKIEAKTGEIIEAVRKGVTPLIGEMPTTHGLWVTTNGKGDVMVSVLSARDDGMPKAQASKSSGNGSGSGNGSASEYVLGDGRVFENCEAAVNALGIDTRDDKNEWLDGKKYYGRLDRLPKEIAEKITKRDKVTPEAPEPDAENVATNGAQESEPAKA